MLDQPEFRTLRALNGDEMSTGSRLKATGRCVWTGQPLGKTPSFNRLHLPAGEILCLWLTSVKERVFNCVPLRGTYLAILYYMGSIKMVSIHVA